ncbi:MAG: chromosome partitioning protein ParB [Acidiferrobacteraceae bacterium]|nr:chromosome partitioning protein ParB [Acidiferrobacteraceae bacterium]
MRTIAIDAITPGRFQPRTNIDDASLRDLAASIKNQGVVQPVVVRETVAGGFELIAGERRWRASQMAGAETIPAVVRRVSDEIALALGLIENIQRENLNPIEEAMGLKRLLEEFGMTHQQVADSVGRSRASVTNLLRILNLDPIVKNHIESDLIEMGHGRALLALPRESQASVSKAIIQKKLSVRQTEQAVRRLLAGERKGKPKQKSKDADVRRLENELSEALGAKAYLEHRGNGGRIVIDYHSLEELDGIIEKLRD